MSGPEHPASLASALFAGRELPPLAEPDARALAAWLVDRRLAPEAAAASGAGALGSAAARALWIERERTRAQAVARHATLHRCDAAFRGAGVPALLLKGEAVVALTHRDASRRPMADIDLLVAGADRPAAARALEAAGFVRPGADTALHDVFLDPVSAGPGLPRGVAVEVHEDVLERPHPFAIDADGALLRAAAGRPGIHAPRLEDALVLTSLAFLFHETDGRKSWMVLRDVGLLAREVEAAGDEAALRAAAGDGAEAAAVAALVRLAARHAGGSAAPAEILGAARPETTRRAFAIRLALGEIEATLRDPRPEARSLTRRLAAALWQRRVAATLSAAWRRLRAPGGGGAWGRLARQARALRRLGRA